MQCIAVPCAGENRRTSRNPLNAAQPPPRLGLRARDRRRRLPDIAFVLEPAMSPRSLPLLALALAAGLAIAGGADARVRSVTDPQAPRALADNADSAVKVSWTDPAQFSEIRYSRNRWEAQRGDWVTQLAAYFQKSATRQLPAGERMDITITDIKRAGDYEPWHGPRMDDVRIVKDIYPPRLSFRWTRTDASGQVLGQGEEKLADTAFLMNSARLNDSDPLRYEKRMIDDWLRRSLREDRVTAGR